MKSAGLMVLTWCLAACCGCGPKTIHVAGEVTYQGKPVEEGTIELIPVDGTTGPSSGGPIKKGRYEVRDAVGLVQGGTYQVRISALAKTGKTAPNILEPGGPPLELSENYIPPKFNLDSSLRITISSDSTVNTQDFHLEPK